MTEGFKSFDLGCLMILLFSSFYIFLRVHTRNFNQEDDEAIGDNKSGEFIYGTPL